MYDMGEILHKKNNLDRYKKVKNFLLSFPSKKTRINYKSNLKRYFDFLEVDVDEYIKDVRFFENNDRIRALDDYEADVRRFWADLIDKEVPPKTVNSAVAIIRVFLRFHHIEIEDRFWKELRRRGNGNCAISEEIPVTPDMLQQIMIHGSTKERSLFLLLSTSGMRIGEALKLLPNHVDFESNPTKITIPANIAKNKVKRITFITDEATKYLKEWLNERDEYLRVACERTSIVSYHGTIEKSPDDDRLFPYSQHTAQQMWNRLCDKTGYGEKDEKTRRRKVHIHSLRKYFRTQFSRYNRDIAEKLMGHEGYLTREYFRITEEELAEKYLEGCEHLLVFERPMTPIEAQQKIEGLETTINAMIQLMRDKNLANSDEIEEMIPQKVKDEAYNDFKNEPQRMNIPESKQAKNARKEAKRLGSTEKWAKQQFKGYKTK